MTASFAHFRKQPRFERAANGRSTGQHRGTTILGSRFGLGRPQKVATEFTVSPQISTLTLRFNYVGYNNSRAIDFK